MTWHWRRVISCSICLTHLLEKHVSLSLSLPLSPSLSLSFSVFFLSVSVFSLFLLLSLSLTPTHTHTLTHTLTITYTRHLTPSLRHTYPHHSEGMHWFPRPGDTCTYLEVCLSPHSQTSVLPGTWNQMALQTEDSEDIPHLPYHLEFFLSKGLIPEYVPLPMVLGPPAFTEKNTP